MNAVLIKDIAVALLLPPTSLVFVALAGLIIGRRIGRLLAWVSLLGLLLLSIPAVGGSLLNTLESNLPLTPPQNAPPQAIVVLGGDVRRATDPSADMPGPISLERVSAAAALYRRTQLPILVSGGSPLGNGPAIALLMAASLQRDFHVPVASIEARSRDTWENAKASAAILRDQGKTSVYLVTDAWHMRRALIAFAGTGITVTAAPTTLDAAPTRYVTDFLPSAGGWLSSYLAIHEWIGCAWYALH